ncbi:hypothetical protein EJF36_09885 [Bacillus sp. HMF5848]|uniref:hypothetical protein n=1 Tax=Bacillus sp. HMF5848 TaxID=2495421 RepID=UPI000F77F2AF|nr:hypothetical protein [Bacillus sp. HMF5848]RSK27164.1 hypothetical protein EJF36_09885 [Bacillus sp. HMF5848]
MKKIMFAGATLLLIGLIVLLFLRNPQPIELISSMRPVENLEIIDTIKDKNGTIVYSFGEANSGKDYMYGVDMFESTLRGYRWLGGGGHVNNDMVKKNKDYLLSIQALTEEQNIKPIVLGIIQDSKIVDVTIISNKESGKATIYEGKAGERFYVVSFSKNIADATYVSVNIRNVSGNNAEYLITGDALTTLKKGRQFYLNDKAFDF